jgi:hypothetical protein
MASDKDPLVAALKEAAKAVDDAELPDDLRPAGFSFLFHPRVIWLTTFAESLNAAT